MTTLKNSGLLGLVKEEMEVSLKEIEEKLEEYVDNPEHSQQQIKICCHNLHQIGGVCRVVGMPSASMLVDEMEEITNNISMKDETTRDLYLEGLGQGVTMLTRYLAYVELSQKLMPETLLPTINEVRLINNKSSLPENYFFDFTVSPKDLLLKLPKVNIDAVESDQKTLANSSRRLRKMYQIGLLGVIKNENLNPNLKLMHRALSRIVKISGDVKATPFLQLGIGVVESFHDGDVEVNRNRKMLLGKLDRVLKGLALDTEKTLDAESSENLIKECIYIISLGQNKADLFYKSKLGLENKLSDKVIRTHLRCMTGPDGSAINAIVVALQEELLIVKEALDLSNRGKLDDQLQDLMDKLYQIAKTLVVLELDKTSEEIVQWTEKLSELSGDDEVTTEEILSNVADLLFRIENSVNHMLTIKITASDDEIESEEDQEAKISSTIYDEAKTIVVKESRLGITDAKNAITSYMDAGWDVSHLVDVPETLNSVSGALLYLKLSRASLVFNESKVFIQERLLESEVEKPNAHMMETLADALSSIDYYLESLEGHKPIGDSVLLIAEESMNELGYPVAAV